VLEDSFKIKVADEEILPENLDSLNRIAAYVQRKAAAG
jgi:acyl carrier protein